MDKLGDLTRENILQILQERHLQIENIDELSFEELLHIYQKFALPLEKRDTRISRQYIHSAPKTICPMQIDVDISKVPTSSKWRKEFSRKRSSDLPPSFTAESLTSATKRIKI